MELTKLATDSGKENKGVWVSFDGDTSFLLGSVNSIKYREKFREFTETQKRKNRNAGPEEIRLVTLQVYAEAIVLDWKGITREGKEFPCNVENALWVLVNVPSVRDFVLNEAAAHDNFRIERVEEAKSKLGETSLGG